MANIATETAGPRGELMNTSRLEAFSDGVIAIIVTIMVLEIRPPEEPTLHALRALTPVILAYVLSFVFVGIYWVNHHHLLKSTERISGPVMWANMLLLFWLSLTPFVTAWVGQEHNRAWPAAAYGIVAFMCAISYSILVIAILAANPDSVIVRAIGADVKGKVSLAIYALAIALAFVSPWLAYACFVIVAIIWFIPDRRLERALNE